METDRKRQMIRENYADGRREAEARLGELSGDEAVQRLVIEGATRMLQTEGLDYSHSQGFWHAVSDEPLDIVRKRIPETANV